MTQNPSVKSGQLQRGYRFLTDELPPTCDGQEMPPLLTQAEQAYSSHQWGAAMEAFGQADRISPLAAGCLERWATAAQCAGDLAAAAAPLERAAVAYSSLGDHLAAARVTIGLARLQIESLDAAVAQGCLRRAGRLLAGVPRGELHGFLAWMTARLHLYQGNLAEAQRCADEAREIGRELGNADIESMGLVLTGIALQGVGNTVNGIAMQDEAAATVLAGDVSPLVGGIIYCGVISSCCNTEDWQRAEQWTESFTRWCERARIETFAGACHIHRAEVFAASGKLSEAQEALTRADPLIRIGAPWALGDAYRLMGDVQLARGEDASAEQNYLHAYQHGGDPYPGYAILLHQRGRGDEAVRGLTRAAAMTHWVASERRCRYIAHAAQIASLNRDLNQAQSLLTKLDLSAKEWESGAVAGHVERARGEWLSAKGEAEAALGHFTRSVDILRQRRAVLDTALARLRLAEILSLRGDRATADMELSAAESTFEAAGALGYLTQCHALRARLAEVSPG